MSVTTELAETRQLGQLGEVDLESSSDSQQQSNSCSTSDVCFTTKTQHLVWHGKLVPQMCVTTETQ